MKCIPRGELRGQKNSHKGSILKTQISESAYVKPWLLTVTSEANTSSTFSPDVLLICSDSALGFTTLHPVISVLDIAANSRNAQENVSRERKDKVNGNKNNNTEEAETANVAWGRKECMAEPKEEGELS